VSQNIPGRARLESGGVESPRGDHRVMEQVLDTGGVGRPRRDADESRLISEEQAKR
jgi:hypothetical protein